ncbi:MAG: peptidyl-prolyl cis-trans isomerase [Myxococcales bacterium]|nr:peptidyl-prolyl cis-trans isomerase [Myxococcales bacterium]MCB9531730.1 peptidyl-prolyl cis-trans isomerase [Myxococcales bacterium]MCB9534103.1 peptidyl-prolyl cis-trans isomerase [Myxococcales bacterium]
MSAASRTIRRSGARLAPLAFLVLGSLAAPACKCGPDAPTVPSVDPAGGGSGDGTGAAAEPTPAPSDAPCGGAHPDAVALVNCEPVMTQVELAEEIRVMVERYERLPGREPTTPEWRNERRRRLVRAAVQQALLEGWVHGRGVQVTDEDVVEQIRSELGETFDNDRLFERFLAQRGVSREQFIEDKRNEIAIDRALAEQGQLEPSDDDIAQFYAANRERYQEGERVRVRTITVRLRTDAPEAQVTEARTRIDALRRRVTTGGEDFAAVATSDSESADRVRGGDRGWIARGRATGLDENVEAALFRARVGTVTEPLRTELGFQIFEILDHRPEGYRELDEVRDVLYAPLRRRNRDRLSQEVENSLIRDAQIVYNEDVWGLETETGGAEPSGLGEPVAEPPAEPAADGSGAH